MELSNKTYSGVKDPAPSGRELAHGRLARRAATQGMVLLKNENLLPLDPSSSVALFGGGAVRTVKGGIGSGDVNNRENVSIYRGLREADVTVTSEAWIADYEKRYEAARMAWKEKVLEDARHVDNPFDAYADNPFALPEGRKVTAGDLEGASAAVYVVSRIAGEGKDRRCEEGDYYLSKKECRDIRYLNQTGIPMVLLLNVGAPVELTDILQEAKNIRAVLNISLPGQEGGHAVADVLLGRSVPGGRLTATWAKRYGDYPSAGTFGHLNENLETEEYKEGIYVGYRYFDSFGIEPLFPFGYGLSYTDFSVGFEGIRCEENSIAVSVSVKNTGEVYCGSEVVQVYVTLPQAESPKEYQRLAGFAKTKPLKPQEAQRLTISVEQAALASYSEQAGEWVIEAGDYGVWAGKDSAFAKLAAIVTVPKRAVLERVGHICPPKKEVRELWPGEALRSREKEWLKEARERKLSHIVFTPGEVKKKTCLNIPAEELAAEATVPELIPLLYGNITQGASTLGSAGIRVPGSAGETTEALEEKYKIPSLIMADGPAGLRLRQSYEVDRETGSVYGAGVLGSLENGFLEETEHHENADTYYQYCTAFPVGTALAQSWDVELMREFGKAVAEEMKEFHVDLWLAPGMNIQRNPLCGRSFEYYSEDPFLSGIMAAAVTDGVQGRKECGVTIKHFACNNQEDNRMGVDAVISERALREIYLRGFEIAVKKSSPAAVMSAYNRVNGVHAANNRDLCTAVARGEWGFEGVIMSDWNTTVPEDGSVPWQCIEAGNDIIMPGNRQDDEDIREAYRQGKLTEEVVRRSAGRIIRLVQKLKYKN